VLCEACKLITAYQMEQYQQQLALKHLAAASASQYASAEAPQAEFSSNSKGGKAQQTQGDAKFGVLPATLGRPSFDDYDAKKPGATAPRRGFVYSMCACLPGFGSKSSF